MVVFGRFPSFLEDMRLDTNRWCKHLTFIENVENILAISKIHPLRAISLWLAGNRLF